MIAPQKRGFLPSYAAVGLSLLYVMLLGDCRKAFSSAAKKSDMDVPLGADSEKDFMLKSAERLYDTPKVMLLTARESLLGNVKIADIFARLNFVLFTLLLIMEPFGAVEFDVVFKELSPTVKLNSPERYMPNPAGFMSIEPASAPNEVNAPPIEITLEVLNPPSEDDIRIISSTDCALAILVESKKNVARKFFIFIRF